MTAARRQPLPFATLAALGFLLVRAASLVVLTREGGVLVKTTVERESDGFDFLGLAIPASKIGTAARVLRELRQHLAHYLKMSSRDGVRRHHNGRQGAGQ